MGDAHRQSFPHSRSGNKRQIHGAFSQSSSSSSSAARFCDKSRGAAVDIVILVLVVVACGLLFTPYLKRVIVEAAEILPLALIFVGEIVYQAPVAYMAGAMIMFVLVIGGLELYEYRSRKCSNPKCQGLRNCVEFDIQLECEEGNSQQLSMAESEIDRATWEAMESLGHYDHKELEAKLKKMAPPNGRAVLVLRYPCGCPVAQMAVPGSKKPRKVKK